MPLKFPGAWRFKPPADGRFLNQSVPDGAVRECMDLVARVASQGDRHDILEHFKGHFCAASGTSHVRSTTASWAETDLWDCASQLASNAPLFIDAFYSACQTFTRRDADAWAPDADVINALLTRHEIGYVIKPPRLELRDEVIMIPVTVPPPSLAERAATHLQESLARSEQLLSEGRGREAVQESLWLLETVATAFRGLETATGTVEGKYFNQIVRELRDMDSRATLRRVLDWVIGLHGYLSSPTGGGVRHGLDLSEGVPIDNNEARLFCNLIRSYLSFLLAEHQRLSKG